MSVEFGVEDLYHFADEMVLKGGRIGSGASQVLKDAAGAAEQYQRDHLPRASGDTANSVGTDYTGDGRFAEMLAQVGVTTPYWRFGEYGTVEMPANPVVARSGDAADTVLVLGLDDVLKQVE